MRSTAERCANRRWTEQHERRLIKLHRRGDSDGVIARRLGFDLSTIWYRRGQLGLKANKPRPCSVARTPEERGWEPSPKRIAAMTAVFRRRANRYRASTYQPSDTDSPRAYTLLLEWCEVGIHKGNQGRLPAMQYGRESS